MVFAIRRKTLNLDFVLLELILVKALSDNTMQSSFSKKREAVNSHNPEVQGWTFVTIRSKRSNYIIRTLPLILPLNPAFLRSDFSLSRCSPWGRK